MKSNWRLSFAVPVELMQALEDLPVPHRATRGCTYYFWNGLSSYRRLVTMGQKILEAVFRKGGVRNAHAHRFRHTLATEILERGGTLDDVADVLGISVTVARKHYVKWSVGRERRIVDLMRRVYGPTYTLSESEEEEGRVM